MNETPVSVMDMLTTQKDPVVFRGVREELFNMNHIVKNHMDTGLSADEMATARMVQEAVQAAENIVEKLEL